MAHWANLLPLPPVGSPPQAQPEAPLAQATFAIWAATLLMPKSGRERAAPPTTCRPNGLTCWPRCLGPVRGEASEFSAPQPPGASSSDRANNW